MVKIPLKMPLKTALRLPRGIDLRSHKHPVYVSPSLCFTCDGGNGLTLDGIAAREIQSLKLDRLLFPPGPEIECHLNGPAHAEKFEQ